MPNNKPYRFIIDDPEDGVQKSLVEGHFYEQEELDQIKALIKPDFRILDIGANVGNHAIYFNRMTEAREIIVFEPVERAYKLLLMNVALNYCHRVNLDFIGLALGSHTGRCRIDEILDHNLGGTRLKADPSGPLQMVRGDDLFAEQKIDFIKLDVEGMEIDVLSGLQQTLQKNRPLLYIEVDELNAVPFQNWLEQNQYVILQNYQRYSNCKTHMIKPQESTLHL